MAADNYFITVTTFEEDLDKLAVPLILATNAIAMGGEATVWTTSKAVMLGKKGASDGLQPPSFPAINDLLDAFKEAGGRLAVCPACAETHGVTQDNIVDNGEFMGAAAVIEASQGKRTLCF